MCRDGGEYILDQQEISSCSENQLSIIRSRKIGFVFQQFNLLEKLTAYGNVGTSADLSEGTQRREKETRVRSTFHRGVSASACTISRAQLSGGQQQKVAIARALVTHPSIILADEPTGNLDSKSGEDVMRVIHDLSQQGNTIVMITHNEKIASMAGRKVHMSDGCLKEEGAVI